MRYERLKDFIDLAARFQGSRAGVTLDDIQLQNRESVKSQICWMIR